jgi:two-component system chemotaxis response regulator CheB
LKISDEYMNLVFCEECGKRLLLPTEETQTTSFPFLCDSCQPPPEDEVAAADISKGNGDGRGRGRVPGYRCYTVQHALKVLVVDDSKLIRSILRGMFEDIERIEVVGEAANGVEALEMIPRLQPHVVILDIKMPVMDGLRTLKHIMIRNPVPTVMFSALTREGATETFDALRYGAVDFMLKPSRLSETGIEQQKAAITERIFMAANVEMGQIRFQPAKPGNRSGDGRSERPCRRVIAVGAGEGGYGALLRLVPRLRADLDAALVIVLYAAAGHVDAFALYLDDHSQIRVRRAKNGDRIEPGCCYLSSGSEYVTLNADRSSPRLHVTPSPFPNRRGTVDMLMISLADALNDRASGVILTGAGKDGVEGIGEITRHGGTVLVQEPQTCLFGEMPKAAIVTGKYSRILADSEMAQAIHQRLQPKAGG